MSDQPVAYNVGGVNDATRQSRGLLVAGWMLLALSTWSGAADAQREVRWQLDPAGFPDDVSVLADVRDGDEYKLDLEADDFEVGVDEFVGDQGGRLRGDITRPGKVGAQILLLIDRSRTYTRAFSRAKSVLLELVSRLDPTRDRIALATTPTVESDDDATLTVPFTEDGAALRAAISRLQPLGSRDKRTARLCHALDDGLRFFPEEKTPRFRAVVLLSAGIDRGARRGGCVETAFRRGRVPLYLVTYEPDRRYRDAGGEIRLENRLEELAEQTGGRSIFRREAQDGDRRFVDDLWRRVRHQYLLKVAFPCFRPAPATDHSASLKVEGRDAKAIRFEAASVLAPTPRIDRIEPTSATRSELDEGHVELIIEGSGFCGTVSTVRAWVGVRQVGLKRLTPTRIVASLNEGVEQGNVKVVNRFGQSGSSAAKFGVVEPARGAEASSALVVFVVLLVLCAMGGVLLLAFRARRLRTSPSPEASGVTTPIDSAQDDPSAEPAGDAAATVKVTPLRRAWLERAGGQVEPLSEGYNLVGRHGGAKIRIDADGVSREHARFELVSAHGVIWLEDLGSTNGTLLGRRGARGPGLERVTGRVRVEDGDVVVIGGESMTVRSEV